MVHSYLPAYIRDKNRGVVLDLMLEHRELTRSEISRLSNISFPTIVKITDFFLEKGVISESELSSSAESGLGRKGQVLQLNPEAFAVFGVFFEGDALHVGLFDLTYHMMDRQAFPFQGEPVTLSDYHRISQNMTGAIRRITQRHPETTILGVGIGLPGIVDGDSMTLTLRSTARNEDFFHLFPSFKELDLPIFIENDMNAASYGEMILRKDPDYNTLLYLSLGTGFGSGIIIDNSIWHGTGHYAGDVGNILIRSTVGGDLSEIDSLRLERYINIDAIASRFGIDIRKAPECSDEMKAEISDYLCTYLLPVMYNLGYILDISQYVLAGLVTDYLSPVLFERIESKLALLKSVDRIGEQLSISPSISGDAGVTGAAAIALERCLTDLLS